jgi:hypothetical protein
LVEDGKNKKKQGAGRTWKKGRRTNAKEFPQILLM